VRQIATANGWTVELKPREGGGTAACVRLPLEESVVAAA
jgi:signal transduction histidine kinase